MIWPMIEVRIARRPRFASAQINEYLAQRLAALKKLVLNVRFVTVPGQWQQQISCVRQESELYCPGDTTKESLMAVSIGCVDCLQLAMRSAQKNLGVTSRTNMFELTQKPLDKARAPFSICDDVWQVNAE